MTDPRWTQVAGEIAHIRGERQGSARFDQQQPEDERQGYDNLILLCPKHHKLIDRLEPERWTVEELHAMKDEHLQHVAEDDWCTDADALRFALSAIEEWGSRNQVAVGNAGDYDSPAIAQSTPEPIITAAAQHYFGDRFVRIESAEGAVHVYVRGGVGPTDRHALHTLTDRFRRDGLQFGPPPEDE